MLPLHQGGSGAPSLPHGPDARGALGGLMARCPRRSRPPVAPSTRDDASARPPRPAARRCARRGGGRVGRAGPRDLAGRGRVDHRGAAGLAGVRGADRARRRRARALLRAAAPLVRPGRATRRSRSGCPPCSRSASAPRCSPCSAPGSRGAGPGSRPGSSRPCCRRSCGPVGRGAPTPGRRRSRPGRRWRSSTRSHRTPPEAARRAHGSGTRRCSRSARCCSSTRCCSPSRTSSPRC